MWRNFILVLLGLSLVGVAVPARADNTMGVCNATIAVALGAGHQLVNGVGDPVEQCSAVAASLIGFLGAGCLPLYDNGELRGVITASNAPFDGTTSPLGDTICTSLILCGLGPVLPPTVCSNYQ